MTTPLLTLHLNIYILLSVTAKTCGFTQSAEENR